MAPDLSPRLAALIYPELSRQMCWASGVPLCCLPVAASATLFVGSSDRINKKYADELLAHRGVWP